MTNLRIATRYNKRNIKKSEPRHFVENFSGAAAISRACTICGHYETVKKPPRGRAGRGWGLRNYNILQGRLIQHIHDLHPEVLGLNLADSDSYTG